MAHQRFRKRAVGIVLAGVSMMLCMPLAARAACVVTNTDDSGPGSLRACVAAGGQVVFSISLYGKTIAVDEPIIVSKYVTISGPGPDSLTISGRVGVFAVSQGGLVSISGLTFANGGIRGVTDESPIFNRRGSVTVEHCIFSRNTSEFGGAISTIGGALAVHHCTFSANSSNEGGAIFTPNGAFVEVTDSTFSGNPAQDSGGAIYYRGTGSSVAGSNVLIVWDSTFTDNRAPSGGDLYISMPEGAADVINCTFSGNTGGIYINAPPLEVSNSILSVDCTDAGPGSSGCPTNGRSGNVVGVNAGLAPLGNYGGPTLTMLPLPGSAAICAGALSEVRASADQRGFPRVNYSYTGYTPCVDAGAVQTNYQSVAFAQASYSGSPGVAISDPAPPLVSATENGQNRGGVPMTLSFIGTQPGSASGYGPVTTIAEFGALFNLLKVGPAGSYTLEAVLPVLGGYILRATAGLNITGH